MPTIVTPDQTQLNTINIDELKNLIGESNGTIQTQIDQILIEQTQQNNELIDHETRISQLESENPEQLRGLTDTKFGVLPDSGKDQYTVKYDYTSDKFMLLPDNSGINDAPINGQQYIRIDEGWQLNPIQSDAVNNGLAYIRKNNNWS